MAKCACVKSELDLFSLPLTQESIQSGYWVEFKPVASLTDTAPIEFNISGSGDDYIDLDNTFLHVQAKIVRANGDSLTAEDSVGPVIYWLNSLFSQIDVTMNDTMITSSNNTYPYRALLEALLSFGKGAKKSHLTSALWFKDENMESLTANPGLTARKAFSDLSKTVDMMGKLHLDITNQDRYLLNGVDMHIRLVRSRDAFSLMSNKAEYKVEIEDASLYIRRAKINPAVQLGHIKGLELTSAKYPIQRVDVKAYTLSAGSRSFVQENLFFGQVPRRVVLGLVDNAAYNGHIEKNPFHFKHHKLNHLALYLDGQQVASKALTPNFANNINVRSYCQLFIGTGKYFNDEDNDLTRSNYVNGHTLFAFDMTPDLSGDSDVFNLVKQGNLRVELTFAEELQNSVNFVVYVEFNNIIEIDRNRNVFVDYRA